MSRRLFIKACLLLAVTSYAQTQYVDFFQSLNTFLQPFTTSKPKNDATKRPVTKHRQTNKQKYQDAIFFETDDFLKQKENSRTIDPFNIFTTTTKPRRKSTKTSTTSHSINHSYTTTKPKLDNTNKIINHNRNHPERSVSNANQENNIDNKEINNARRIDNYNNNAHNDNGYNNNGHNNNGHNNNGYNNNGYNNHNSNSETTKTIYNQNIRPTTQRTMTNYFNTRTTQKSDYYGKITTNIYDTTTQRPYNRHTTKSSLLNRPGVKPAVVDENRPPITNRPITSRPVYDRPYQSGTNRPSESRPTRPEPRPVYPRPVNTRPPFETERPISTGVARPVESRPVSNENTEVDIEIGPDEDEMADAEKRRLYDICERKCEEYKSLRVKKVVALPLSGGRPGVEVNVSSCAPDTAPLIIGGQVARIETFPHMALLGWKNIQGDGYKWKCGGSLLSERYVLTAGHCTYHDKDYNVVSGPPSAVQLGSSIYSDSGATVVQVSLVVRHPKYKLRRSYYDVALIKLAVDVSFSDTIMPACLGVPPPVGEPIVATGWGKTEYGGDSSIQLRSVSIPIWDMNDCRDIWGTSLKLPNGPMPDNQICAGEKQGAKDTCQGDSGGPAQVRDGCAWRVVAVTSVGRSCGAPETPALYARVPRAFIAKQVYTNVKTNNDGGNQYGNGNNNWNNNGNNNPNYYQPNNRGVASTTPTQYNNGQYNNNNGRVNNNGQNYNNNARKTNNNGQYYGDSQESVSNIRDVINSGNYDQNNGNNNWGETNNNNRYNGNNNNGYENVYGNNGQTTSGYSNQNAFGQTNNYNGNNNYQNGRNTANPSYDPQTFSYDNNGRTDNTYKRDDNNNPYNMYPVANRPWWTR